MKMKKHKVDICPVDPQNWGFMYTYVWWPTAANQKKKNNDNNTNNRIKNENEKIEKIKKYYSEKKLLNLTKLSWLLSAKSDKKNFIQKGNKKLS